MEIYMYDLYFSACAEDGGIYHYRFDGSNAPELAGICKCPMPMYAIRGKDKLHALLRAPFNDNTSGLVSYDIGIDGTPENPGKILSTKGIVACHLAEVDGNVYCVNYLSGSVIKMPDTVDVHKGRGVNQPRQDMPHTHYVSGSPDGKYILVTDLGIDKIFVYDKNLNIISTVDIPAGHGPRHLAFHDDGRTVFCVNELASTVSVLKYSDGELTLVETTDSLAGTEDNTAAAIRVEKNSVFVSNRGDNSVSELEYDGRLHYRRTYSSYGKDPRDMWVTEKMLILTNQTSNNVTFVSRKTGELLYELGMPCPISVLCIE
ncbi:MAG: beta-propeller fold lactonase family protein [Clostridiales bacterium]|nr:beta-propeller fold lactonase family protein [Clostridiales bacterium]